MCVHLHCYLYDSRIQNKLSRRRRSKIRFDTNFILSNVEQQMHSMRRAFYSTCPSNWPNSLPSNTKNLFSFQVSQSSWQGKHSIASVLIWTVSYCQIETWQRCWSTTRRELATAGTKELKLWWHMVADNKHMWTVKSVSFWRDRFRIKNNFVTLILIIIRLWRPNLHLDRLDHSTVGDVSLLHYYCIAGLQFDPVALLHTIQKQHNFSFRRIQSGQTGDPAVQ